MNVNQKFWVRRMTSPVWILFYFPKKLLNKTKIILTSSNYSKCTKQSFFFFKKSKNKKGKTQKKQKEVGNEIYQAEYSFPLVVARNYSIKYCYKSYHIIYSIKWMNMELKLWAEVSDILHTHPPFNVVFSDCMSA